MEQWEPRERFLWLVCGLLLVAWAVAVGANFGLQELWQNTPHEGFSMYNEYSLLLGGSVLVLAALMLAWMVYSLGTREMRRQAERERQYRYALEEAYRGTLHALTSALDLRDGETYGHCRRVMGYSLAIGRQMGLPSEEMQTLAWGALLHDLGKIGIRDAILLKPGKLTPEEWAEMQQHVVIGYQMVQSIPFLSRAATVIRFHHERFDGKGYPDGVKGEEIPLLARIFSVADAFDAMTSSRPYRKEPLTMEEAIAVLRQESGRQFCPKVVEAFLQLSPGELEEIRQKSFMPVDDLSDLLDLGGLIELAPGYYRDPLTGTQNRAAWEAKKAQIALISGADLGTLIFLDVDGLKQVNDTKGHLTGDRVLADLGARLCQLGLEVYRIGGDEFVLWVEAGRWDKGLEERLRQTLEAFDRYWRPSLPHLSVSWGVATADEQTSSLMELIAQADMAMYRRKAAARLSALK